VISLTCAAKCFSLSHRMGEGRGEGRSAEQSKRAVEFSHCALTLHPSPVRREREMRHSAEVFIQFFGSSIKLFRIELSEMFIEARSTLIPIVTIESNLCAAHASFIVLK
jgi:hypothetical protein